MPDGKPEILAWVQAHFESLTFISPGNEAVHLSGGNCCRGSQAGCVRRERQPLRNAQVERIRCVVTAGSDVNVPVALFREVIPIPRPALVEIDQFFAAWGGHRDVGGAATAERDIHQLSFIRCENKSPGGVGAQLPLGGGVGCACGKTQADRLTRRGCGCGRNRGDCNGRYVG